MATSTELQEQLRDEIALLQQRFIDRWLPAQPEHSPDDYQHDVKAYCVLTHAVFEEFVEELSLIAVAAARDAWIAKKFTPATLTLLMAYGFALQISDNEDVAQERLFDQVRQGLDICVDKHSKALSRNHGFSLKYLRAMLTPVGIDVPESVKHLESLRELAEARGSYAHSQAKRALYGQWKRAGRPMEPEKAKLAVQDCLELCDLLADRLEAIA